MITKSQISFLLILLSSIALGQNKSVSKDTVLMGVSFSITAIDSSYARAKMAVNKAYIEIGRIEKLISSWDTNSQTSKINYVAGKEAVKVDIELFNLIKRSLKLSKLTNGYFDISFASIDKVWNFSQSENHPMPSKESINNSIEKINFKNIILNKKDTSVFLKMKGMKIGFGAIGKGYSANKAKLIMQNLGITSGVINAGGDLVAWGHKIDESPWSIGIKNPLNERKIFGWIDLTNTSLVTSGNYEKFILIDGKKYCHIINPKTGFPTRGISSVTIICDDTEIADGLATSVFILGKTDGLALINHLEGVEGVLIDTSNNLYFSKNLKQNFIPYNQQ